MNSSWNRQQLLEAYRLSCSQSLQRDPSVSAPATERQSREFLQVHGVDISTLSEQERVELLAEMHSINRSTSHESLQSGKRVSHDSDSVVDSSLTSTASDDEVPPFVSHSSDDLGLPTRYQPLHKIGEGGLGQIWRVLDTRLNREIAIKTCRDDCASRPRLWERLAREAELTGQLQHPGIPPTYDAGRRSNGIPFFSMKLIEGETLASLLQQLDHDRNEREWLNRFSSLVQTIAFAHSQAIIHRDIKPHNVMVGRFGELQVMDWGLARSLRCKDDPQFQACRVRLQSSD